MSTYKLKCRYRRFEGGRLVRYQPGSVIELNEVEAQRLRYAITPVVTSATVFVDGRDAQQDAAGSAEGEGDEESAVQIPAPLVTSIQAVEDASTAEDDADAAPSSSPASSSLSKSYSRRHR